MAEIPAIAPKSPMCCPPFPRLSRTLAPRSNAKDGPFASVQGLFLASLLAVPLSPMFVATPKSRHVSEK
jgi:hypothetical protein